MENDMQKKHKMGADQMNAHVKLPEHKEMMGTFSSNPGEKKWIQKAGLKKGSFTKQAKSAGMSVQGYAKKVLKKGSKASSTTKKRAVLAQTFKKMGKGY